MDPTTVAAAIGPIMNAATSLGSLVAYASKSAAKPAAAGETAFQDHMDHAIARFIKKNDKDGDGQLSAKEFGGDAKVFAKYDLNGDGKLDASELRGLMASSQTTPGSGQVR